MEVPAMNSSPAGQLLIAVQLVHGTFAVVFLKLPTGHALVEN
jgi:hypothetical protein